MTALILSFLLGLGIAYSGSRVMKGWFDELRVIVSKAIGAVIIPLLPLYIFGIFLNMTMLGQVGTILMTFMAIIVVIFVIHVAVLLIQYSIAGAVTGKNPLKMLWTMLPAYFTALGTQSSAATIPVTMAQVKKAGVRPGIARIRRAAVRYHPSVGQYAQDRGLRAGADDNAGGNPTTRPCLPASLPCSA